MSGQVVQMKLFNGCHKSVIKAAMVLQSNQNWQIKFYCSDRKYLIGIGKDSCSRSSMSSRPNPEDRKNRKADEQKNDQTTEKAKNHSF